MTVKCHAFKPADQGALKGFVRLQVDFVVVNDCRLMSGARGLFIALPTRSYTLNGRKHYSPLIEIAGRESAETFQQLALAAIEQYRGGHRE